MPQPNLLFLYTDEQAINTLAAYGNRQIAMPHLNRLAEQSVVFEQAYVTQAVCTPSRSSLHTGLYPHTNGCVRNNLPLDEGIPCLPEMMPRGEYAAAHIGKWHLGDEIFAQHGFATWVSIEDEYRRYYRPGRDPEEKSSYYHFLVEHGYTPQHSDVFRRSETARFPEEHSKPAFLARKVSRFLREHRDRPFLCYVNFLEPHMPFTGPRDDQYDPASMPLPANFDALPDETQPLKARLLSKRYCEWGIGGLPLQTPDDWRRVIANYWGLCSQVDTYVGEMLATLEACGLAENTIVVFTSDHGDMMGSHRLIAKGFMFEEAVRVPLMIRLPGQTAGRRVRGPVSQIDLVPTLLDLLGQPAPDSLQGRSLRGLCEGEGNADRPVFIEWNTDNLGGQIAQGNYTLPPATLDAYSREALAAAAADQVRTVVTPDGWKLNCSEQGRHELYHLGDDPCETANLYRRPEYAGQVRQLRALIRDWQARTGDTVALGE